MLIFYIILIILYIWYIQIGFTYYDVVQLTDIKSFFKTGDIILFKAYNNINSIFTGLFFGHMGIVIMDKGVPMLLEANGIEHMSLLNHHPKTGIFYTPLIERIQKYKGRVYYKRYTGQLGDISDISNLSNDIKKFIEHVQKNMYYETNVFLDAAYKAIGEKCYEGTNCGQLVFLMLIKLGILQPSTYNEHIIRHVKYIVDLEIGSYLPIIQIIDHPFAS